MGLTGLIWLAIVAVWFAYLVPRFLLHKDVDFATHLKAVRTVLPDPAYLVRRGRDTLLDPLDPDLQISTPLQRQSVLFEARRARRLAAHRRRVGLLGSVVLMVVAVALAVFTPAPWWLSVCGGGLLLVFLVLSRISVYTVDNMIADKINSVEQCWAEDTVTIETMDLTDIHSEATEISISLDLPEQSTMGDLWEPIAITPPTYVSKPLVPRSVRTIDLSMPSSPASEPALPVTADSREEDGHDDFGLGEIPHAVGE